MPEDEGQQVSLYLKGSQVKWLQEKATAEKRSVSFVLREIVNDAMEVDYGRELENGQDASSK